MATCDTANPVGNLPIHKWKKPLTSEILFPFNNSAITGTPLRNTTLHNGEEGSRLGMDHLILVELVMVGCVLKTFWGLGSEDLPVKHFWFYYKILYRIEKNHDLF